jgi:hypothetical protein
VTIEEFVRAFAQRARTRTGSGRWSCSPGGEIRYYPGGKRWPQCPLSFLHDVSAALGAAVGEGIGLSNDDIAAIMSAADVVPHAGDDQGWFIRDSLLKAIRREA